jgi:HPt (histidine-containing phosphotransfer) domain-containing protein
MFDITTITILLTVIIAVVIYIEYRLMRKPRRSTDEIYHSNKLNPSTFHKPIQKTENEKLPDLQDVSFEISKPEINTFQEGEEKNIILSDTEDIKKELKPSVVLPKMSYPKFNHSRLLEMGLSEDDAKELITELIAQIETQLPLIQNTIRPLDIDTMAEHIHYIKGSATNLGSGGISDLLVDFYSYIQKGRELEIIQTYFEYLKSYYTELKEQY